MKKLAMTVLAAAIALPLTFAQGTKDTTSTDTTTKTKTTKTKKAKKSKKSKGANPDANTSTTPPATK